MGRSHHHVVDEDPAVGREVLQHGDQELQTAVPVTEQQHHPDEVEDANHSTGQVIGHVKDLRIPRRGHCGLEPFLTISSIPSLANALFELCSSPSPMDLKNVVIICTELYSTQI